MIHDFKTHKTLALSYWEKRRIVYNLCLIPAALGGFFGYRYLVRGPLEPQMSLPVVAEYFLFCAIGANICYSFAYAVEFLLGADRPDSAWMTGGRTACFVAGLLLSVALAFVAAGSIATMVYGTNIWDH
jgi:hypothetical protein